MALKIKKAKFNLTIQPKNEIGLTQASIDASAAGSASANINVNDLFDF